MNTDMAIDNQGTIVLFTPLSKKAKEWIATRVAFEPWQMFGNSLAVEYRIAADLVVNMEDEGLLVSHNTH